MYLLEKHTLAAHIFLFQGICFIRTSRPDTAVIYSPDEKFEVGVAKVMISASGYTHIHKRWQQQINVSHQVVRQSDNDHVTVIGAGVTLHETLAAADMLASEGNQHYPLVDICRRCLFHNHI